MAAAAVLVLAATVVWVAIQNGWPGGEASASPQEGSAAARAETRLRALIVAPQARFRDDELTAIREALRRSGAEVLVASSLPKPALPEKGVLPPLTPGQEAGQFYQLRVTRATEEICWVLPLYFSQAL